jgi:uncharacterized protein with HEPN domain
VKRNDRARIQDALVAIEAIEEPLSVGSLTEGLVFDAVRMRIFEIGEALVNVTPETMSLQPDVEWQAIRGMRNRLAHGYFDTEFGEVEWTATNDLPPLRDALVQLIEALDETPPGGGTPSAVAYSSAQPRKPQGTSSGGRFAAKLNPESSPDLD